MTEKELEYTYWSFMVTPQAVSSWLKLRLQRTKTTKHSLIAHEGIQNMTLADDSVIWRSAECAMRVLINVLVLQVWLTILPGSTTKTSNQITWAVCNFTHEKNIFEKMIESFLIWFWMVSKLIRSYRKYGHVWTCDARCSNPIVRKNPGLLHTTRVCCQIYTVQSPFIMH